MSTSLECELTAIIYSRNNDWKKKMKKKKTVKIQPDPRYYFTPRTNLPHSSPIHATCSRESCLAYAIARYSAISKCQRRFHTLIILSSLFREPTSIVLSILFYQNSYYTTSRFVSSLIPHERSLIFIKKQLTTTSLCIHESYNWLRPNRCLNLSGHLRTNKLKNKKHNKGTG